MKRFLPIILLLSLIFRGPSTGLLIAQETNGADRRIKLFKEDTPQEKRRKSQEVERYLMSTDEARSDEIDFKAPSIEVMRDTSQVKGSDGVVISGKNIQVEADKALYSYETKDADLSGNVNVTGNLGTIKAAEGKFNIENETGDFRSGEYMAEDGGYTLNANELRKLSEYEFSLEESYFTTCQCKDNTIPWSFRSDRCSITQESYAHCYGTRLEMYGLPIIYTPWFAFPVKTERSSGLLVPRVGGSSRDGFEYRQPIYIVPNDYSDIMLTPFVETLTRNGSFFDYRRRFAKQSSLGGRFIYSNERPRNHDLRGTNIEGIFNPTIDDDRVGGYYKQSWSTEEDAWIPTSFLADGHYVSDNLMLREIDDTGIGLPSSRFLISEAVLRNQFTDYLNSEIMAEYNQTLIQDQALEFQRLPEVRLGGLKSWRPFGYNPFGIKLITRVRGTMTEFSRQQFYDGQRYDLMPVATIPLRYRNYFQSAFEANMRATAYDLANRSDPTDPAKVWDRSPERVIPTLNYRLGTGVERIFQLEEGNWLTQLTSLGAESQTTKLARIKHTIEPTFRYLYTPPENQDDIPIFDSNDRIKERNLIFYGFKSRLLGRFLPVRGSEESIPEITPEVEDLPRVEVPTLLEELAGPRVVDQMNRPMKLRTGRVRELANISLLEGYSFVEARKDLDPLRNGFTDMTGILNLYPTDAFSLGFLSTYSRENAEFTSWEIDTSAASDRGDTVTLRYSFMDKTANPFANAEAGQNQIRVGAETVLTERLRFGLFTRYDSPTGTFIDSRAALRILSACNCWSLDLGYALSTNPDREKYLLTFTFGGLGGISQNVPFLGYRGGSEQTATQ